MNELNVKNWLLQDYISYWNQWSLKHFGAFSFVILNYFKKKNFMFIPHHKKLVFHGFDSFCINCAIFAWEISVTSKCISHQSSKAMQILHTQTWFPAKTQYLLCTSLYTSKTIGRTSDSQKWCNSCCTLGTICDLMYYFATVNSVPRPQRSQTLVSVPVLSLLLI